MVGIESFISNSPFDEDDRTKESFPSEYKLGVMYQGPWTQEADGFNEHVRRCARALYETGCPVHLRSNLPHAYYGAPKELNPKLKPMLTASISRYSALVHQMILSPSSIHNVVSHPMLTPEELSVVNRFKVISTVFEKDHVPPDTAKALNRVGQVWVACHKNKEALVSCGVNAEKIRVIPIPFFPDDPILALRNRDPKKGIVRFYHIGKWEPRKAQDQIFKAFMLAFKPGEAKLIVRCSGLKTPIDGYPQGPVECVNSLLARPEIQAMGWTPETAKNGIEIILEKLSDADIVKLHGYGDVYVTLSRGEGFDVPAFEAKLAGNLMVYTPSGGPQDFADKNDVLVPASGSIPCHSFYRWEKEAKYLDFELQQAIEALQEAKKRARQLSLFGTENPLDDLMEFSSSRVGSTMLECLTSLVGPECKVFER